MPLLELVCKDCGHVSEELVKADGQYPKCPVCGGETAQKYSGKCYVNKQRGGHCEGNCSCCKGCK